MSQHHPAVASGGRALAQTFTDNAARWRSFATAIDGIHQRANERVGAQDLEYIRGVDAFSRRCGLLGRALLYLGPGPVSFTAGVSLLWIHKQLQMAEIGHTVLHGAFNRIEGAQRYRSGGFRWRVPIDERSWIAGHNGRHHGLTNIQGSDPDIDYGYARLTHRAPHRFGHYFQVPLTLLTVPVFSVAMNVHFTGILEDGPVPASKRRSARKRFFGKVVPYFAKELGLLPLLAGPRVARVLAGNALSEIMRDIYTAATIYCGHVGADVASFPEGTRARSKGERYAMQVAASNDFNVPWAVSVLCGGLNLQIEHHLFPNLPTNRLREVATEVRTACEAHGVEYRSASWPATLWRAFTHVCRLSLPDGPRQLQPQQSR